MRRSADKIAVLAVSARCHAVTGSLSLIESNYGHEVLFVIGRHDYSGWR